MKRFAILVLVALAIVALGPARPGHAANPAKSAAKSGEKPALVDSVGLLQRVVARDSSNWGNLYRLGVMLIDHDRPQEAQQVLLKASRVRPGHVPTLVNLGAAYDAMGQAANAQKAYNDALKITPDDTVATCRLASSLYSTGDYGQSVDLLRALIAKNPGAYCAYFTLGVAFADAGIYKDAIRMWEKVVALAPSSPEALSAKESIDVLQRVIKSEPAVANPPTK